MFMHEEYRLFTLGVDLSVIDLAAVAASLGLGACCDHYLPRCLSREHRGGPVHCDDVRRDLPDAVDLGR